MLGALLRFELAYHARQLTFRVGALVFFGLGMLAVQGHYGGPAMHQNAPYVGALLVGLLSLFAIFATTLFCANVVLRDTTYRLEAVVLATAVKKHTYFLSRFLGLVLALICLLGLAVLGLLAGCWLLDASQLGPFRAAYYWQPLVALGIPNILFPASLLFATAVLTRNVRALYAVGVLLYILYWTASILGNSPLLATATLKLTDPDPLPLLLDPFGLAAFFSETRRWTDAQRNTQLFALQGLFLLNRLLWLGGTAVALGASYYRFTFRSVRPLKAKPRPLAKEPARVPYRRLPVQVRGVAYAWAAFRRQLSLEVKALLTHIPFMVLLALWVFFGFIDLSDTLFHGAYGLHSYPATGIIVEELRPARLALVLLVFYAAELLSREQAANMQGLLYSTPVPAASVWAAKCLALGSLVAVLVSANIGIGLALQLTNGYTDLELPLYLSLFYYSGVPLVLFAILAVFVQALTPNKYLGMLLNMLLALGLVFSRKLGLEHYLLRYAVAPPLAYSALNGFGHYATAFAWYMLYWSALAGILAWLTVGWWPRAQPAGWGQRVRAVAARRSPAGKRLAVAAGLLWLAMGGYIYYATNVVGHYRSEADQLTWQLRYEQQFKPLASLPQPVITAVQTAVDLYPTAGRYTVRGTYQLKNETAQPLTRIWVSIDPEVTAVTLAVPGARHAQDQAFNQHWFTLKTPLLPGAQTSLRFSMEVVRSGFMPFNSEDAVVSNGTYLELEKYVPQLGYVSRWESTDVRARQQHGLPAHATTLPADSRQQLVDFETTISTSPEQYVATVGTLRRTWAAKSRRYFRYQAAAPIPFMFALSSARYAVSQERYKGVVLRLYYHPGHTGNLAPMRQAIKDALDYGTQHFGPYPLAQLTVAEIPQYRGAATAYPGLIFSAERFNFLGDFRDTSRVNLGYATLAHEVAHQWWAYQLAPVAGPGASLLTESLAKYTEAMVVADAFGSRRQRDYLRLDHDLYFAQRNTDEPELPLVRTAGQPFVTYQKGGLVLVSLRAALGEIAFDQALRRLLARHRYPGPAAYPDELRQELARGASARQLRLLEEGLNQVVVYDARLRVLACQPLANGHFRLHLQVTIRKTNQLTNQTLAPDEEVTIAVFDREPASQSSSAAPFYVRQYHFAGEKTDLSLEVAKRPRMVALDWEDYLLDEDLADNRQAVD